MHEPVREYFENFPTPTLIIEDIDLSIKNSVDKSTLETHWTETETELKQIHKFSPNDKAKLQQLIENKKSKTQNGLSVIAWSDLSDAITSIALHNDQIPAKFYNNIDPTRGFGIARFIADRMQHLSNLLKNTVLEQIKECPYLYIISSESKDSGGNSIKLEHRFKATNDHEAKMLYEKISSQLAGVQLKIWLACWSLANKHCNFTYTCPLTDLMSVAYPGRKTYFSVAERVEFYEHLKSLEQTNIVFSKPKSGKGKKELQYKFDIPLLKIPYRIETEAGKYPQQLTLSIMNASPNPPQDGICWC